MAATGGMNVLRDCVFTLTPGGVDDGEFTPGAPVQFKVDEVRVNYNPQLADHSTNQDEDPKNRILKKDWSVSIETKLDRAASSGVEQVINNNELAAFAATQKGSTSTDLYTEAGIIANIEWGFRGPNTLRFEIHPYGMPLNYGYAQPES